MKSANWPKVIAGLIIAISGVGLMVGLLLTDVEGNKAFGIGFVAFILILFGAVIAANE